MSVRESPAQTADAEGLRQEYAELSSNIRHYSLLRFTILTVYFAAFGALASVAFGFVAPRAEAPTLEFGARIGGLLVTGLFLQYERLIVDVLDKTRERGREIEQLLGYRLIVLRSQAGITVAQRMARAFYWIVLAFWVGAIALAARDLLG